MLTLLGLSVPAGARSATPSATPSGSDLSATVRGDVVVRVRWRAVPGASAYRIMTTRAAHLKLAPAQAFKRLPTLAGPTGAAANVTEWETTGYQPLDYTPTFGRAATSSEQALLSPVHGETFKDATAAVSSLGAATRTAYVRQSAGGRRRYAVAATVGRHVRYVRGITATSVRAAAGTTLTPGPTVTVNPGRTYQTIDGWGAALNDADAYLLSAGSSGPLDSEAGVEQLAASPSMMDLFSPENGIGLDYIRVSIGGNDYSQADYSQPLSITNEYTEGDPAPGSTATSFSPSQLLTFISHDLQYQVPVLLAARRLNPSLQILAAPWTAPVWMKCTNADSESGGPCDPEPGANAAPGEDPGYGGGALNPVDEAQYADYLLEFVLAYRAVGLPVQAISIQNEPANGTAIYPTMLMSPEVEAVVADDLKSDETQAGVDVPILELDHNWNSTWPPTQDQQPCAPSTCYLAQLNQAVSPATFSGVAYHCYGGSPSVQDTITAPLYETECTTLGWYTGDVDPSYGGDETTLPQSFASTLRLETDRLLMAATEDGDSGGRLGAGAKAVMFYNMVADQDYGPTLNEACVPLGAATENSAPCLPILERTGAGAPVPEAGFYVLGQFSKFVLPGAVRIAATIQSGAGAQGSAEAFRNPDGQIVLVVLNTAPDDCDVSCVAPTGSDTFNVRFDGASFSATIPPDTVQTYLWNSR